ncbi:retron Ec78 anti-phage system effector HNH endonuclease PtuB [Dethiosulfovibrio salsuginis]|nr:retron Ec78 anti-phage system effector HNH endonuclease PtuB [Dethiosulfovibrio salsuginis]
MHYLKRISVFAPACLKAKQAPNDNWSCVTPEEKSSLREALMELQGKLCAYCEGIISDEKACHIEHFFPKGKHPRLTFDWDNLFLSCDNKGQCGRYKDTECSNYDPRKLIKPDRHDPDDFLFFHSNGKVMIRSAIDEEMALRASETIRVLNLNEPGLVGRRKSAVGVYIKITDELDGWSDEDIREYIGEELKAIGNAEYITTIRHFLTRCLR